MALTLRKKRLLKHYQSVAVKFRKNSEMRNVIYTSYEIYVFDNIVKNIIVASDIKQDNFKGGLFTSWSHPDECLLYDKDFFIRTFFPDIEGVVVKLVGYAIVISMPDSMIQTLLIG